MNRGLLPPASVSGHSWPCGPKWRRRSSLQLTFISAPWSSIRSRGNQSVALMIHLLSGDMSCPLMFRPFDSICDTCHSCLLPDLGVMLSVLKCYAQHNPLHLPPCHRECIHVGGDQCPCLAAIGHYRDHILTENLPRS